ncbi:MAG: hypothetical protein JSW34_00055 [Candidatus Zixiibacteriota bacterium]|nr:MAG: hypothetical protein JSW34_00055 [candidate division Zixibacteria bacterium]
MYKRASSIRKSLPVIAVVLLGVLLSGCSSDNPVQTPIDPGATCKKPTPPEPGEGSFTLEAKYTYIRSYPTGGGVMLLKIVPGADMSGDVAISIDAHKTLGAQLTTGLLNAESAITELTVSPTRQVPLGLHVVTVTAENQTHQQSLELEVEVFNWGILSMNKAQETLDQFTDWLSDEHPELGNFANQRWELYSTYPLIKIVEHYTFLSDDWEFRICFHVMIPPNDWSKMWLRPRGEWEPVLAAQRAWDDTAGDYVIEEIPVGDYPIYFGY